MINTKNTQRERVWWRSACLAHPLARTKRAQTPAALDQNNRWIKWKREAVSVGLHEAGCAGDSSSLQVQEPQSLQVSKSPSPRHRGRLARSRSAADRLDGVDGPCLPPSLLVSERPSHLAPPSHSLPRQPSPRGPSPGSQGHGLRPRASRYK
jgi:hypothetical protein